MPVGRCRLGNCEEPWSVGARDLGGVFDAFETGDRENLREGIAKVVELLQSGFPTERLPKLVVERSVELSSMVDVGVSVLLSVLRLIEFCGCVSDGECEGFVSSDMVSLLMKCLSECDDESVIRMVFASMASLMDPEKPRTVAKLREAGFDAKRVLEMAGDRMRDTSAAPNSFVSPCIHLLKNLFCSLSLDKEMCDMLVSIVCCCYDHNAVLEWRVDVMQALGCMAFWKPELFRYYVDAHMLDRICSSISVDNEMLSVHGLVAVDNACFDNEDAAHYLIVQKNIMDFACPSTWHQDSFVRYCRALVTVISSSYDSPKFGEVVSVIKHRAQTLIAEVMQPWDASSFAVKEVIAHLLCNLVNIGHGELTQLVITGNWILVDYLCEMLASSDSQLVCSVLAALVSLCSYGDKVAFNLCHLVGTAVTECPNPFLARVSAEYLDSLMEQILDSFGDSEDREKIVVHAKCLRQEVERATEFLEIDFV